MQLSHERNDRKAIRNRSIASIEISFECIAINFHASFINHSEKSCKANVFRDVDTNFFSIIQTKKSRFIKNDKTRQNHCSRYTN